MFVLLKGSAVPIFVKLSNHKGRYENGQSPETANEVCLFVDTPKGSQYCLQGGNHLKIEYKFTQAIGNSS